MLQICPPSRWQDFHRRGELPHREFLANHQRGAPALELSLSSLLSILVSARSGHAARGGLRAGTERIRGEVLSRSWVSYRPDSSEHIPFESLPVQTGSRSAAKKSSSNRYQHRPAFAPH